MKMMVNVIQTREVKYETDLSRPLVDYDASTVVETMRMNTMSI